MSKRHHGNPCWYELTTSKGNLQGAENFYRGIFGWEVEGAGMPDFDYRLAKSDGDMVAGLMAMPEDAADITPFWMIYFAVDDADAFVADAKAAGGQLHRGPDDIPGTGRFALLADPQGAGFGILEPDTTDMPADMGAFNQNKPGHGNWQELMSTDPAAGFAFYSGLFGWTRGEAMDMGPMGTYQLFAHEGADIGGMMGLGQAPKSNWLPYFGVDGAVSDTIAAITAAGGHVHHGPVEVPGGAFIAIAQDPQGAWFAIVGSRK